MKLQLDTSNIDAIDIMINLVEMPIGDESDIYTKNEVNALEVLRRKEFLNMIGEMQTVVK